MNTTARELLRDLDSMKKQTEDFMGSWDSLREGYAGPYYTSKDGTYQPENHAYEWCTNVMPQLIFSNPKVKLSTRRGGQQYAINAAAMQEAMNRLVVDNDLEGLLADGPVLDMQFGFGVAFTSNEPQAYGPAYRPEGMDPDEKLPDHPVAPKSYRISPRDHVWDLAGKTYDECRIKGHRVVTSKEGLIRRAKDNPDEEWNTTLIEAIVESRSGMSRLDQEKRSDTSREDIVYWHLWIPEWQQEGFSREDGFQGTIVEIAEITPEQDPDELGYDYLRPPRPFYGPDWGPYTLFGCHVVPDEVAPLGALVAVDGQAREVNAVTRAVNEAIKAFKKFVVVDEFQVQSQIDPKKTIRSGKKLADLIAKARNLFVYNVPGFDANKAKEFAVGGADATMLTGQQVMRDRLDRMAGIFETPSATRGDTATANIIADQASGRRISGLQRQVRRSTVRLLRTWGWYLHNDEDAAVLVGNGPNGEEVWFKGGPVDDSDSFALYQYDIEPYSMEQTSVATMQAQAALIVQYATNVVPMMPMAPWWDWQKQTEKLGALWNMPELSALLRPDVLAEASKVAAQQQTAGVEPKPQGPMMTPKAPTSPSVGSGGKPQQVGAPPSKPKMAGVGS